MSNEQTQNPNTAQQIDYCYEVLTTIKFRGVVIKPQAFLQLSDAEAAPLIAKGYISAEQVLPPEAEAVVETGDSTNPNSSPVTDQAGGDQQDQVAAGGEQTAGESELTKATEGSAGDVDQAAAGDAAAAPGATGQSDGGERPAVGAATVILHGSDNFPALIKIGDAEVQLGEIVGAAYAKTQLTEEAWNALPDTERDALLQAEIDARLAAIEPAKTDKPAKAAKTDKKK